MSETAWQLSKDGVYYALELSFVSGVAGQIAVGAAATATAAAATGIAAPAVVAAAGTAAFWGTALGSSMAVSSLTGTSMDWVKARMENLGRHPNKMILRKDSQ